MESDLFQMLGYTEMNFELFRSDNKQTFREIYWAVGTIISRLRRHQENATTITVPSAKMNNDSSDTNNMSKQYFLRR